MQPSHCWGQDLVLSSTGDLARAEGTEEGQQRVLRRLMTPVRGYIFHPTYGAGLPAWVGETQRLAEIESLLVAQMHEESVVGDDPSPSVLLTPRHDVLAAQIQYVDALTGQSELLAFDVRE